MYYLESAQGCSELQAARIIPIRGNSVGVILRLFASSRPERHQQNSRCSGQRSLGPDCCLPNVEGRLPTASLWDARAFTTGRRTFESFGTRPLCYRRFSTGPIY